MPGTPAIIMPPAFMRFERMYISQSMFGLSKPSCGPPQRSACPVALRDGETTHELLPEWMKTPKRRFSSRGLALEALGRTHAVENRLRREPAHERVLSLARIDGPRERDRRREQQP